MSKILKPGREKEREAERRYYWNHREQRKAKSRRSYWKNVEKSRTKQRAHYRKHRESILAALTERRKDSKYRAKEHQRKRDYTRRLHAEMVAAYGGKCRCCGETIPEFLTLDHVNGDGKEHRLRVSKQVYADLKRRGWPKKGYRLLCMNCNWSIGVRGYCPHQTKGKR